MRLSASHPSWMWKQNRKDLASRDGRNKAGKKIRRRRRRRRRTREGQSPCSDQRSEGSVTASPRSVASAGSGRSSSTLGKGKKLVWQKKEQDRQAWLQAKDKTGLQDTTSLNRAGRSHLSTPRQNPWKREQKLLPAHHPWKREHLSTPRQNPWKREQKLLPAHHPWKREHLPPVQLHP